MTVSSWLYLFGQGAYENDIWDTTKKSYSSQDKQYTLFLSRARKTS